VARSPSDKDTDSKRGNRADSRLLSAWERGTSPVRGGRCTRGSGRPRILSSSSIYLEHLVPVPKAKCARPEAPTRCRTPSVITLVMLHTREQSRLWMPFAVDRDWPIEQRGVDEHRDDRCVRGPARQSPETVETLFMVIL
jgi:hypothetical protein